MKRRMHRVVALLAVAVATSCAGSEASDSSTAVGDGAAPPVVAPATGPPQTDP